MKRWFIRLACIYLISNFQPVFSQTIKLWGVSAEGGESYGGTLFSLNSDGSAFQKHYDFKADAGFTPLYTHFILGGDGFLYGMTSKEAKNFVEFLLKKNLPTITSSAFMSFRTILTFF